MRAGPAGYYEDPKQQATKSWQQAQLDYVDSLLQLAGLAPKQQQVKVRGYCGGNPGMAAAAAAV